MFTSIWLGSIGRCILSGRMWVGVPSIVILPCGCGSLPWSLIVLGSSRLVFFYFRLAVALRNIGFLEVSFSKIFFFLLIIRTWVVFLILSILRLMMRKLSVSLPSWARRGIRLELVTVVKSIVHSLVNKLTNMKIGESVIVPIHS